MEAEDLFHWGTNVDDPQASGLAAVKSWGGIPEKLWISAPLLPLAPGNYSLTLRLKLIPRGKGSDRPSPFLRARVLTAGGGEVLAEKSLTSARFSRQEIYQEIPLEFRIEAEDGVDVQLFFTGGQEEVWADRIALRRSGP